VYDALRLGKSLGDLKRDDWLPGGEGVPRPGQTEQRLSEAYRLGIF